MNWKKIISTISAIAIAIILIAIFFSLGEGQSDGPCDRLDPCCYGEDPDYRYHFDSTTYTFKMWEKIDRNLPGNVTLFELWHYAENNTSLFFDNTTGYVRTALSLQTLHYYVTVEDKHLVSKDGLCWIDRMVEYLK